MKRLFVEINDEKYIDDRYRTSIFKLIVGRLLLFLEFMKYLSYLLE